MRKNVIVLLFLALLYSTASAHHSKRYLEVEGYDLPGRGHVLLFLNMGYHVPDLGGSAANHWEFAPGVFYGLTSGLGVDLHPHLHKQPGEDLEYEATSLALIFAFLPGDVSPVHPAVAVDYERSDTDEPDLFSFKLILGGDLGPFNLTANYIGEQPVESAEEYRSLYAVGASKPWGPFAQMGLEVKGTLSGESEHYLIPGLYLSISKFVALKAGAAFGITRQSEDFSFLSSIHLAL